MVSHVSPPPPPPHLSPHHREPGWVSREKTAQRPDDSLPEAGEAGAGGEPGGLPQVRADAAADPGRCK